MARRMLIRLRQAWKIFFGNLTHKGSGMIYIEQEIFVISAQRWLSASGIQAKVILPNFIRAKCTDTFEEIETDKMHEKSLTLKIPFSNLEMYR